MSKIFLKDICLLNAYKQVEASLIDELISDKKEIALLPSSQNYGLFTSYELGNKYKCTGEVITIGRARYANIKYYNGDFISSNNIIIQSNDTTKALTKYIYYFLLLRNKELYVEKTTYPVFDQNKFNELTIDLPSLNEQLKTVQIFDNICNAIYEKESQLLLFDELVKSRFIEMFGDPVTNPFGWRKLTVQQAIGEKIIDKPLDGNHGGKHPKTSDYVPSGIPFIMANNLVAGKVDLENCAFISRKQADSLDKGFAKDGDVLITHKGTIGRTAILHCSYPYIMLTPQVTYYRPKIGIIPEYLKAYFDTDYFQGIIGNIASVGSTRAYIGIIAQQELPLIVPPMEVQEQYATFVEQIDKSKLATTETLKYYEELKAALMNKYFG